jgi:hypothetical protein
MVSRRFICGPAGLIALAGTSGCPGGRGRVPVPGGAACLPRAASSRAAAARVIPAASASWAAVAPGAPVSAATMAAAGPPGGAAADGPGWSAGDMSGALSVAAPAGMVFALRVISVIPLVTFPALFPGPEFYY